MGFLYAGSPAVMASLWQVDDQSTAELMGQLYEQMIRASTSGTEEARLEAFVTVRKALREKHAEPYFWAPFIYIGDPR